MRTDIEKVHVCRNAQVTKSHPDQTYSKTSLWLLSHGFFLRWFHIVRRQVEDDIIQSNTTHESPRFKNLELAFLRF